jgi:hypothetical protein
MSELDTSFYSQLKKCIHNFLAYFCTGGKFAAGVVDTGGNFAAGVVNTGGKFATGVVDTGGAPLLANSSANFRKNSKWS